MRRKVRKRPREKVHLLLNNFASMTTFADSLKREIARVARKELKQEITALRKAATSQRAEISALKRQLKAFQAQLKLLGRDRKGRAVTASAETVRSPASTKTAKPGRKAVFSAQRLKAQRARLGLTQEQMGRLLGVSSLSIWKWESGAASPRPSRVPHLLQSMALGKREALRQLS